MMMPESKRLRFNVRQVEYEVFLAKDGLVELYESKNPGKTGFVFPDKKRFNAFLNLLTDVAERFMEMGNETKQTD
jgi:hypothetical protein